MTPAATWERSRSAHPIVFLILIVPFGVMNGYLTVAVAYLLSHAGLSVAEVAEVVAVSYIPHTWKFLWAPIADTTLTRKRWYVWATLVSASGIAAIGSLPSTAQSLPLLNAFVLISNVAVTFLAMSVESLMAYGTHDSEKGRAGGWFQAGSLGGVGLGGGAGLWLTQALAEPWMAGVWLGAACLLCSFALLFIAEPPVSQRAADFGRNLLNVLRDLWTLARSGGGSLALLLCFLPIGTGAASGLWSAVSMDWRASADTVALVTGALAGIVSAVGCIVGGYFCDRMNRKAAYVIYGLLQAACCVAMAAAPRTESMYIVFTTVYAFITGLTYAAFSAVALEAIGRGAAATKYNLFASLSNMPIAYMIVVDGWAHTHWNAGGMLYTEAAVALAGLLLFLGVGASARRLAPTA